MAEMPESFLVHRAAVFQILGHNAYGEEYGESVDFPCFISHKRRLIRSNGGEQIVSEAIIRCPLALEDVVTPESEITLHVERSKPTTATVVATAPNTDGGVGAWQHLRVEVG